MTWASWALAAGLATAPGCLWHENVVPPGPACAELCAEAPAEGRDHVYLFIVHGLDPLDTANLAGVRDQLNALGFRQTYYGRPYHAWYFDREVRRLHREDPDARFVLLGYGVGTDTARSLAHSLQASGIPVELLVDLDGSPAEGPQEVRTLTISPVADLLNGGSALEALAQELAGVAVGVPVTVPAGKDWSPAEENAPTPRRVEPAEAGEGWDFLKPVPRIRPDRLLPRPAEEAPVPRTAAR
jgi:hypothetical protein